MPDLDLMKQGGTGGAGLVRAVRQGPVGQSGRPRGCRDRVNRAARLTLAGEGEIKSCATGLSVRSFSPLINTVPEYELAKHCAARMTPN